MGGHECVCEGWVGMGLSVYKCVSVWAFHEIVFDIDHSHSEPSALVVVEP